MLLQSQDGYIALLPALPSGWRSGSARGLRARGNVSVDFNWNDSRVEQVTITGLPLHAGERGGGSVASGDGGAAMDGPDSGASGGVNSVEAGELMECGRSSGAMAKGSAVTDGPDSVASGDGGGAMDGPYSGASDGVNSVEAGDLMACGRSSGAMAKGSAATDGLTTASTDDGGTVTAGGRNSVVLKVPAGSIARDLYGNEFPTDSSGFVHLSVRSGESVTIRFGR